MLLRRLLGSLWGQRLNNFIYIIVKKLFLSLVVFCVAVFSQPLLVSAAEFGGLKATGGGAGYAGVVDPDRAINTLIATIIESVLGFLGVIFLVLMVYGGYTYMMARGNEQDVEKAMSTIRNAVIGLIIVASAYAISILVINTLSSSTLKEAAPAPSAAPLKSRK